MKEKTCHICNETKAIREFYKRPDALDGYRNDCKSCTIKRSAQHYLANSDIIAKKAKQKYDANREAMIERVLEYQRQLPAAVYRIYNKENNRTYIGQSKQYSKRWRHHRSDLKLGIHRNPLLQADYDKYGLGVFEFIVVEEFSSQPPRTLLLKREQLLIDEHLSGGKEIYNQYMSNGEKIIQPNEMEK
jgi:hypothetical protein